MLTSKTRWCSGTNLKLISWIAGQTIQLDFKAFQYVLSILSLGDVPSMIAIEERKTPRLVEAKSVWSRPTRARMVRLGLLAMLMRRWRKANQFVAAGPKTAGGWFSELVLFVSVVWWKEVRVWGGLEGGREVRLTTTV